MSVRRHKSSGGLLRALSVFELNDSGSEFREAAKGKKRDAPVDVGPSLLLATMRTNSSMMIRSISIDDLSPRDDIVLLMGPPESGKTTFIEIAAGAQGLTPPTDVSAFRVSVSKFPDSSIVLVHTPAFNDTDQTDIAILNMISDWLNQTYKRGIRLCGLIYFHRISDPNVEGIRLRNWRAVEKICGDSFNKVVLATTMWNNVDNEVGCNREKELEDFWKANIVRGSCMRRFLHDRPSAADVLSPILENPTKRPLRLQREITDFDMSLTQTTAARALYLQLEALLRECKQNLITIRDDLKHPSLSRQELRNLEEMYGKTSFLLQRVTAGLADLETAPAERMQRFVLMMGLRPALRFLGLGRQPEAAALIMDGRPNRLQKKIIWERKESS